MTIQIFRNGQRLYVTPDEREILLTVVASLPPLHRTFCETLIHTGCRISEVLSLTPGSIDLIAQCAVVESLKKRQRGIYRTIPLSDDFLALMAETHGFRPNYVSAERLWPWGRTKGWTIVKAVFNQAGISGPWATPKGFRHGFAIHAIDRGVPLPLIQKWMGHSNLNMTAIYMQAVGKEEREIAKRLWAPRHSSVFHGFMKWIGMNPQ